MNDKDKDLLAGAFELLKAVTKGNQTYIFNDGEYSLIFSKLKDKEKIKLHSECKKCGYNDSLCVNLDNARFFKIKG